MSLFPGVVVTGQGWMTGGLVSVETAVEALLREAADEVAATAYAISGAADSFMKWMESALQRGVKVVLIVNHLDTQPADVAVNLHSMAKSYGHFQLFDFSPKEQLDLHAKAIVVDRRLALVGSSNLSRRGLLTNYELGVVVEGPVAGQVAYALDRLLMHPAIRRLPE